jgi:hypothetical protein
MRPDTRSPVLSFYTVFLALLSLGANPALSDPAPTEGACRVLVSVAGSAFDRRSGESSTAAAKQLMDRLTGSNLPSAELYTGSASTTPLAEAIAKQFHLLLELSTTSRDADAYIIAALKKLPENEVIGDTSTGRKNTSDALDSIEKWYRGTVATYKCKDYTEKDVKKTLESGGASAKSKPADAHRSVLSVKFEKVPAAVQAHFLKTVEEVRMDEEVFAVSSQISQLRLLCDNDCEKGRMRLDLPYREATYKEKRGDSKDRYLPYRPVMSTLLKIRDRMVGQPLKTLETELLLVDVGGSTLKLKLSGPSSKPKIESESSAESFFGQ